MRLNVVKALAGREFLLINKKIKSNIIALVALLVLGLLVLLSFYHGNIGFYLKDILSMSDEAMASLTPEELAEVLSPDEAMERIKFIIATVVKIYPALMANFIVVAIGEGCISDERKTWQYFYRSTPATPFEKAAATYSLVIITDIAGVIISLAFAGLVNLITGLPFSAGDAALAIAGLAVGNTICVLMHLGIKYFHSADKAGIVIFSVLFVTLMTVTFFVTKNQVDSNKGQALEATFNPPDLNEIYNVKLPDKVLPIAIPLAVAMPVLGFAVYYLINKRREK